MNVFLHARGDKSVNRLTLVGAAANVGGGNVAGNIFEEVDAGASKLRNQLRRRRIGIALAICSGYEVGRNYKFQRFGTNAGPIGNDEITKAEQRFVFFPHGNIEEGVCADDEENAVAGSVVGVAKIANGIH